MTAVLILISWTFQATFWIVDKLLRVAFWIVAWIIAGTAALIARYLDKKEANHGRSPSQESTRYNTPSQEGRSAPQAENPARYSNRR